LPPRTMSSSSPNRRAWLAAALVAVTVIAGAAAVIAAVRSSAGSDAATVSSSGAGAAARAAGVLTVERAAVGRPIPPSFLGLSVEFPGLEQYAGPNPSAINPIFEQLIRNLAPGQSPLLRVGGDSTDWTWWPVPHMAKPLGIRFTLDQRWLRTTRAIVHALRAHLVLGVNLEADSPRLAAVEARELVRGIGRDSIDALELGNEPELYGHFGWYTPKGGRPVHGRPRGYDVASFTQDFSRFGAGLPRLPLAGPATGAPAWTSHLDQFLTAEPRVRVATLHLYPLQHCGVAHSSPVYPTIPHLLLPSSTLGLAQRVEPYVATAHAHGVALRIAEMNSVSCGATPKVSQTFASALWAVNALFAVARAGVDGVNVHTYPGVKHELFRFSRATGHWTGFVDPEYYGLLMFAQAAPAGSRLLALGGSAGAGISTWATRAIDGTIRVVLINDSTRARAVAVRVQAGAGAGATRIERLQAPSIHANTGVTLGGQSFGTVTGTGLLAGAASADSVTPRRGQYRLRLPATSAAMLTLAPTTD
jgi:hypothetical protein